MSERPTFLSAGRGAGARHAACFSSGMKRRAGMSLVEIMIALAVISLTLLAMLSLITSSGKMQDDATGRTMAYNAARQKIEDMRAEVFAEVYARFNSITSDNPTSGTSPGDTFTVAGLAAGPNNAPQGLITFPESTAGKLTEAPSDPVLAEQLGMPKDLNRDGDTTDTSVVEYSILPVKIEVRWVVPGGKFSSVHIVTYIAER